MTQWTRDDLPYIDEIPSVEDAQRRAVEALPAHPAPSVEAQVASDVLDAVVECLNRHHPKPDSASVIEDEVRRRTEALRENLHGVERSRDSWERKYYELWRELDDERRKHWRDHLYEAAVEQRDRACRERDAAVERAEAAERVLRERDEQEDDATRAACERAEQAENARDTATTRAEQLEKALAGSRDAHRRSADAHMEWKARAEAAERELADEYSEVNQKAAAWDRVASHPALRDLPDGRDGSYAGMVFERITWLFEAAEDARESNPVSAVSRADIEKALRECANDVFASRAYPHMADAVCDLLGIEAEQAVDPVEALSEELFGVAHPGATWSRMPRGVQRQYRAIAAHVLGQEADHA